MFGDVPDPTVMTIRVGSGTASERAREEVRCTEQKGVGMGLGGLWRAGWSERRGERDAARHDFQRPKTSDEKAGYSVVRVIR